MTVVAYECSACGARTDSTKDMVGWAFGTKGRWCPDCDRKKCGVCGKPTRQHTTQQADACLERLVSLSQGDAAS